MEKEVNQDLNKLEKGKNQSNQPIIETKYRASKDGKHIIHETRIISIYPTKYLKKVTASADVASISSEFANRKES